jgi:hypothetical protein
MREIDSMQRLLLLFALLVCSFTLFAAKGPGAVRKQVESSMLVTGTIDIDASGNVVAYALDRPERLPEGIVRMVVTQAPRWAFAPVALPAEQAYSRSRMSLRFIAKKRDSGKTEVALRGARFFDERDAEGFPVDREHSTPIAYPLSFMRNLFVTGTVHLAISVDRKGEVVDSAVEQINLTVIGSESDNKRWREILGRHWQEGSKRLRFEIPASAFAGNDRTVAGRIGFHFRRSDLPAWEYGDWEPHVPGPHTRIDWLPDPDARPDTFRPGTLHIAGSNRSLLTPLTGD